MHRCVPSLAPAFLLLAALATLAGCGRADEESTETAVAEPPPAVAPAAEAPAAPPLADVAPPEGVLRAYVWKCDGGLTLNMKNLYREDAITLDLHEGPRRLPLVVSASGAKYSDGSITFWTKGGTATFERAGSAPVECQELRARSLVADARERGVRYRGTGNEPGWLVEIGPGTRLAYVTGFGAERHEFPTAIERSGETGARVFVAETDTGPLSVSVTNEPCVDDMSGDAFDHRMVVEWAGEIRRGCATAVQ